MDDVTAARCLCELGNPTRLAIFRLLIKAGPAGLAVGDIQRHLGVAKSTLSHHIAHLVWAELIGQTREGRSLRCRANYARMDNLMAFLGAECCLGLAHDLGRDAADATPNTG